MRNKNHITLKSLDPHKHKNRTNHFVLKTRNQNSMKFRSIHPSSTNLDKNRTGAIRNPKFPSKIFTPTIENDAWYLVHARPCSQGRNEKVVESRATCLPIMGIRIAVGRIVRPMTPPCHVLSPSCSNDSLLKSSRFLASLSHNRFESTPSRFGVVVAVEHAHHLS